MMGIRPGERFYELLATEEEFARSIEEGEFLIIKPETSKFEISEAKKSEKKSLIQYRSDSVDNFITKEKVLEKFKKGNIL